MRLYYTENFALLDVHTLIVDSVYVRSTCPTMFSLPDSCCEWRLCRNKIRPSEESTSKDTMEK